MRLRLFAATILALFCCLKLPAGFAAEVEDSVLTGFETTPSKDRFVSTLVLQGKPRSRLLLLRNPDRVAVDLFDTVSAVDAPKPGANAFVSAIRQGLVSPERFRIVMSLKRTALPTAEMREENGRTILSLRLDPVDEKRFAAAAGTQSIGIATADPQPAGSPDTAAATAEPDAAYTIVIDPGHGGVDTGAKGAGGTLEKDVNLGFALALRDALAKDSRVRVLLTREDDRFIPLAERSEIARRAGAKLFISMHADSIRYPTIRGATVYTLSERASDALSREIADSENAADRFAGPEWQQGQPEVFDILVDLTRRETDSFSEHFAAGLVKEFGRHKIRLIKNAKRSAGFRVLVAPDVPSVLVEIGYLSNADDEKLLLSPEWRADTVAAIATAVLGFLDAPPERAAGN